MPGYWSLDACGWVSHGPASLDTPWSQVALVHVAPVPCCADDVLRGGLPTVRLAGAVPVPEPRVDAALPSPV